MARVTFEQAQKFVRSTKGIKMFSFEPGKIYDVIFLGTPVEGKEGKYEPIMYMNPIHTIRKDGRTLTVRCANEKYNISNVVRRDENGEIAIDPVTKKPFNDGTCPYCEVNKIYGNMIFKQKEKFLTEHPDATKEEIKEFFRTKFSKVPVSAFTPTYVYLVAVLEVGANGKVSTDSEGNKQYEIVGMKFSEHAIKNKLMAQVELARMGTNDPNDDGIAWHEFYFRYPKPDPNKFRPDQIKQQSGKDLTISVVNNPVLKSDPEFFEELKTEVSKLDLEAIEEQITIYKLKTLDEMERDVEVQMSLIKENMTDEEIEEAKQKMQKEDKGEAVFKEKEYGITEVTDEDIESLL